MVTSDSFCSTCPPPRRVTPPREATDIPPKNDTGTPVNERGEGGNTLHRRLHHRTSSAEASVDIISATRTIAPHPSGVDPARVSHPPIDRGQGVAAINTDSTRVQRLAAGAYECQHRRIRQ